MWGLLMPVLGPLVGALLAVIPGLAAWWTGRRVPGLLEDPALPELLMARRQRVSLVSATVVAVLVVTGGRHIAWALPMTVLGLLAGQYPLRRALQFESDGLVPYLGRGVKSIIGGLGFWALLAGTPAIVVGIDDLVWPFVSVLLALLLVWEHAYIGVWLRLHDAVPLESDELAPRIQAIVERAGIAAPDVYRLGAPGTRFVNALALPSLHRPSIGLGNALLDLLEPDEAAAIYAHELSHIEQFGPRVLRRLQLVNRLLIVGAVALPMVLRIVAPPGLAGWSAILWPIIVLGELARRARKSQQRETESDLRAAALCGDAEVVARALSRLHMHALIPRRQPVDLERNATHPSLARRIQSLRDVGQSAAATIGEPTILATGREGSRVVFDDARAWWFDGVPAGTGADLESLRTAAASMRSVAWSELIELRVAAAGTERSLRALLRNGDRWTVPLEPSHVASMQNALDRVDVRLQRELGGRSPLSVPLLASTMLAALLLSGQIGILLVPLLLAMLRPSTAAIAALGSMAVVQAVLALVAARPSFIPGFPAIGLPLLAALGLLALLIAHRKHQPTTGRDGIRPASILLGGIAAILAVLVVAAARVVPARELLDLPALAMLGVTLFGLGAALATAGTRRLKRSAVAATTAAVLATVPVLIGAVRQASHATLDDVPATAVEIARIDLASGHQLGLSPGGSRFFVQQIDARPGIRSAAGNASWLIGSRDGTRRVSDAARIEFVDDARVLVLRQLENATEVRLESADSAGTAWTAQLPPLWGARLIVSPAEGTWAVVGDDALTDSLLVLTGNAASPDVRTHRFAPLDSISGIDYLVFDDGARLIVPAIDTGAGMTRWFPLVMLAGVPYRTVLWDLNEAGLRKAGELHGFPQCGSPEVGRATCLVENRTRAYIWSLDASGRTTRIGQVPTSQLSTNFGPGPRVTLVDRSGVTVIDLDTGRRTTVEIPGDGFTYEARSAADRVAILRNVDGATQLVFFRLETKH